MPRSRSNSPNGAQSNNRNIVCNGCQKRGHVWANCYTNPNSTSYNPNARGRSPPPPANNNGNGATPMCIHHPRSTNHTTAQRKRNQNQNNGNTNTNYGGNDRDGDATMLGNSFPAPQNNYCGTCNSTAHSSFSCKATPETLSACYTSKTLCWKCNFRGHTGDQCQNPTKSYCVHCRTVKHTTADCKKDGKIKAAVRLTEIAESVRTDTRAARQYEKFGKGFQWWLSAVMKNYLKERRKAAADEGVTVTADEVERAEAIIRNIERTPGANLLVTVDSDETKKYMEYLFCGGAITHVRSASAPRPSTRQCSAWAPRAPAPAPRPASVPPPATTTVPTYDRTSFDRVYRELDEKKRSADEKAMRRKIDLSRQMYVKSLANAHVRHKETEVLQDNCMTQNRLLEIVAAIAQGRWNFFRDPAAMEAVARGQKPVCNGCHREGYILDKRFVPVQVQSIQEFLELEDGPGWGLFVGFEDCKCCVSTLQKEGHGYRYEDRVPDRDGATVAP